MQNFIDPRNGTLMIKEQIQVDSTTRPQDIVLLFNQDQVQFNEIGNGWTWYMVEKVSPDAPLSNMLFVFKEDSLKQINFLLSELPARSANWDGHSEENELAIQQCLDRKLTECLGAERHFPWGNIGAFYDGKGCSSAIVLQYSE